MIFGNKIILFVLVMLLLSACSTDNHTIEPVIKYRLKSYTRDNYMFTYEYDTLGRLEIMRTDIDDSPLFTTNYFYVNNRLDSLSKFTSNFHELYQTYKYRSDTIYQTTYYYWSDYKSTLKLLPYNNNIVKIINPVPQSYQELHWDNNNLVNRYFYETSGSFFPRFKSTSNYCGFKLTNVVTCTYDEHHNPLKFFNRQISPEEYESSDNNLLSMIASNMSGDTLFRTFSHTYNKVGLPISTLEIQKYNKTASDVLGSPIHPEILHVYEYEEY